MSAAWIGVIGVLGGVVLGAAINLVADHFRWQREDERLERERESALQARRRELCVDFSTAADELFSRLYSFNDYRAQKPRAWRADPYTQGLADMLETVFKSVARSYNELRILGMENRLSTAAERLLDVSSAGVNGAFADEVDWWDDDERNSAAHGFLDAANAELGLTSGPSTRR